MKWLGTVAGIDLIVHGTTSDEDTIRNTAVAQPLIVSAGMVSLLSLFPHPGEAYAKVGIGAGHSVGEITAAAAANVITAEQAMVLVRERGNAMATASNVTPTGMSAVLGGDRDEVIAKLTQHGLTAANENGAGQIVTQGNNSGSTYLDSKNWAEGTYQISIKNAAGNRTESVIIIH
jgi:[acyl-carrier-protein] S-malonyltransferase